MSLSVYYTPNVSIIGTNFLILSCIFQKDGLGQGQTKKKKNIYGTYKDPLLI
jgi:hypothetical protein